jgi:hypothetical protein
LRSVRNSNELEIAEEIKGEKIFCSKEKRRKINFICLIASKVGNIFVIVSCEYSKIICFLLNESD